MKKFSLGLDIGGTKCAVLLGHSKISDDLFNDFIIKKISFPTEPLKGLSHTLNCICEAFDSLLSEYRIEPDDVIGIGISCGGPLDHKNGIIMNPPNLYGWKDVPIVKILQDRYHIPTYLQNDANAGALAEWKFGAAKNYNNVVFLTFGTGMGAGLIFDGKPYYGSTYMAGEMGHIRIESDGPVGYGKPGSFEGFCSGGGIVQIARNKVMECLQRGIQPSFCPDLGSLASLNAKSIALAAENNDPVALSVYELCGKELGKGLSIIIDILNPDIIVLGSIFERNPKLLWPHAKKVLEKEALAESLQSCKVVASLLKDNIGDYAALSVAFS